MINEDIAAKLRALADHVELNNLESTNIIRAGVAHNGSFDVQIYSGYGRSTGDIIAAWINTMSEVTVVANPVSSGYHIEATGLIGDVRAEVACVLNGVEVEAIRAAFELPRFDSPSGDALLAVLAADTETAVAS